ncbi:MAG: aldolase/citrate lyase family protein [Lachnospiraceae bacterium]
MLDLMFITNEPRIAEYAEKAGVGRIFVDLESLGKKERQKNRDTYISNHKLEDISIIKNAVNSVPVMVRVNPINPNSSNEIEECIRRGADILMLPMFTTVEEVRIFTNIINGRARVCLLLETPQALVRIHDIVKSSGVDEIHVGLNDLHLGMKLDFMFELLSGGIVDYIADTVKNNNIKFGFGGIAKLGQGIVPAELILGEHYRIGSEMTILSRTFRKDADTFDALNKEIQKIKLFEKNIIDSWDNDRFTQNRKCLENQIKGYLNELSKGR